MTSKRNLDRRVSELEAERGTADPDDKELRYVITRRTVDGELVEKTECLHADPESVAADEIGGFNFSVEFLDPDGGDDG